VWVNHPLLNPLPDKERTLTSFYSSLFKGEVRWGILLKYPNTPHKLSLEKSINIFVKRR